MAQIERDYASQESTVNIQTRSAAISIATLSWVLLAVAIIGGTLVRIWQINAIGYNTDEAAYVGQAAAIAGFPVLKDLFPIFRAHPLLFQFTASLFFQSSFSDLWPRLLAVVFGVATIVVTYQLGRLLYGSLAGALAAMIMAVMPYHVVVTRQALLDGPMTFFAVLTMYMLASYAMTERRMWLYATGAAMGLTFLSKETGIVLLGSIYAFLALANEVRLRIIDLILATLIMLVVISPFPISLMLAGGSSTGQQYLVWQLFRRPNHEWFFYPTAVPPAIGWFVVIAAVLGLLLLFRKRSWREKLLLSWILVPIAFFQLWPVKGFQYLLPTAPAFAILAARFAAQWNPGMTFKKVRSLRTHTWVNAVLALAIVFSMLPATLSIIQPSSSHTFLAGTGGVPGGRESGFWVKAHTPTGAKLIAIGPSMANIIQFYGERKVFGLAVSPNPLHRNPSYQPVINPDFQIRNAEIQYIVWDSFSAARTPFFAEKLLNYAKKYNGRVIHTESVMTTTPDGKQVSTPVIIIYEVHP